jgi:DUF971 family protein
MKLEQAVVIGDELAVRFSDGVEIYLSLPYVRANCPCAACQQQRDAMASSGLAAAPASSALLSAVDGVGGYALRLVWADGHGSGIYSFDFLRHLDERFRTPAS